MSRPLHRARAFLHKRLALARCVYLNRVWGMHIGEGSRISGKAFLDKANPAGVHIGAFTIVTPGVRVFTHDFVKGRNSDTRIGSNCFIGADSIVMSGVTVGDHCIIAAGSIVTQDVPSRSIVAGNPARVVRSGINTGRYGTLPKQPTAPAQTSPAEPERPSLIAEVVRPQAQLPETLSPILTPE